MKSVFEYQLIFTYQGSNVKKTATMVCGQLRHFEDFCYIF